jgi:hypothetical protein
MCSFSLKQVPRYQGLHKFKDFDLCGVAHHPDFELIGGDVVERRLHLLLDCFLQVTNSF